MNRTFLNKKLFVVLGVVLVFFVMFIFFNKYKNNKLNYVSAAENQRTQEITQKIIQKDSDNDGLKDWEEVLWKTDPNNPDTDEDGMNDNEEVLIGRDPLTEGEGNINKVITEEGNESQTTQTTLTQTDILAREIFTGYVALKQNDGLGTQEQDEFIQKITSNSLNFESNIKNLSQHSQYRIYVQTYANYSIYCNCYIFYCFWVYRR